MKYTGAQLRKAMTRAARTLWNMNIHDPRDAAEINMLFEANDWGAWLAEKTDGKGYANQPGVEYCGHTAAWSARRVGDHLEPSQCVPVTIDPDLARFVFPSTYRLSSAAKWREQGHTKPEHVDPHRVRAGDIITVGSGKPYGTHIALCLYDMRDGKVSTVEGNATGARADKSHGKGVVRRKRDVSEIQCVYRLTPDHFVEQI